MSILGSMLNPAIQEPPSPKRSGPAPAPTKSVNAQPPDIANASVPDTLAALHVNPDTGLTHAEVDVRRKEHGYNEVAEKKSHPVLKFLVKFWGISAWMLELIMVLSAVLGNYSDLESARGLGEGFRPWDQAPNGTMTNANVAQAVASADGQTLLLKYKDGEKKIIVPPATPIALFGPGEKAEVKPGVAVAITAVTKPDGSLETARVGVGRDG